jgi:hypothetical protein
MAKCRRIFSPFRRANFMPRYPLFMETFWSRSVLPLASFLLFLFTAVRTLALDTVTTNQVGQGVVYRHYHYDSLYNSSQEIYVADVNLNDPAPVLQMPFLTNGATRTVSAHAATVSNAVACVNGQFFNTTTGAVAFLKVKGTIFLPTQPGVHDEQGLTDDGKRLTNSIGIAVRPSGGWASVSASNALTAGPDLIKNGLQVTNYDFNDTLVTTRNPRTCLAWTYNNHLLLTVVDGRSSAAAGMTLPELRDYLYTNYSVHQAFNLDGGGSSTMWAGGAVKNAPSDGFARPVADAVAIAAPAPAIPLPPASLAAVTTSNIILSWSVASGAMTYNLKRATNSGGPYTTVSATENTTATNVFLAGSANYFVVTAVNSKGESGNSPEAAAVPLPAAPTGLHAVAGRNEAAITWNPVSGATGYDIKRSLSVGGTYSIVGQAGANAFTNTGLVNGYTYYFVVAATNSAGSGNNSSYAAATPQCFPAAATTGLMATSVGNSVSLNWQPNPDVQSFVLNRSLASGGPYAPLASGIVTTNFVDSAAVPGTVYFYTVSGSNQCGVGPVSAEVSAPFIISRTWQDATNLVLEGWGGSNGQAFYLLSAPAPDLPAAGWIVRSTNAFGASGYFRVTNSIDGASAARFFRVLK